MSFDNRDFWNRRYQEDPLRGSGIGSRGPNMLHKRAVIAEFLASTRPGSILDVGCGDQEVISGLAVSTHYHGIDISSVVIERNRRAYPEKTFTCVDFTRLNDVTEYESDAVLCFEVLIHQHEREGYRKLLHNVVRSARVAGLVSGYVSDPPPRFRSKIIAWHEPVTASLRELGVQQMSICGHSLNCESIAFVSFRPPQ